MGVVPPNSNSVKSMGAMTFLLCRICGLRFHLAKDVLLPKHYALGTIQCPGSESEGFAIRSDVPARARKGVR